MIAFDYTGADIPVRTDLRDAHRFIWEHLRSPGTWWTGRQRVAIAAESRNATACTLCHERKAALSPNAVSGSHDTLGEHGARLIAFTEAVMSNSEAAIARERAALRGVLSAASFVDVAAIIGAFNVADRVADATGIALDPMLEGMSVELRRELNLARFASSANTPGA
ncbi:MAG: hypothetical protein HY699_02650 [Deltaproteobacteria bacterium]|nr:hypothetical protein [Deltaproteobacteria bacterium]